MNLSPSQLWVDQGIAGMLKKHWHLCGGGSGEDGPVYYDVFVVGHSSCLCLRAHSISTARLNKDGLWHSE